MKNPKRIEREHKGKIKQYTPAKEQRLYEYFSTLGAQKTVKGPVVILTIPGRSPFVLRHA